jgi:hypothetical protein
MHEKPLSPWFISTKDGQVLASHCDCMAGCGETCTHVAALMFWVMRTVKVRDERTVTQEPAYWTIPPSVKNVEYREISNINFQSAKSLKRKFEECLSSSTSQISKNVHPVRKTRKIPSPTENELDSFFSDLVSTNRKPAILSIVPDYLESYKPKSAVLKLPKPLTELKNKQSMNLDYDQLIKSCEGIEITVTDEEIENVEKITRKQASEGKWFNYRAGRITASKMKSVYTANIDNPSSALVKSIVYPNVNFRNEATKWGIDNEKKAATLCCEALATDHDNVELIETGLFISKDRPFIGASPDGIIKCDCCGSCLLEVKCPFNHKGKVIDESVPYLIKGEDGELCLDRNHPYFFQIQTQLGVTELELCYFVVWSDISVHIEQIHFNPEFYEQICAKAEVFFRRALLPELVGKYFTRLSNINQTDMNSVHILKRITSSQKDDGNVGERFCYCRGLEEPPMVGCDGENCKIVWFHFSCVNITKSPEEIETVKWYCPDCAM